MLRLPQRLRDHSLVFFDGVVEVADLAGARAALRVCDGLVQPAPASADARLYLEGIAPTLQPNVIAVLAEVPREAPFGVLAADLPHRYVRDFQWLPPSASARTSAGSLSFEPVQLP